MVITVLPVKGSYYSLHMGHCIKCAKAAMMLCRTVCVFVGWLLRSFVDVALKNNIKDTLKRHCFLFVSTVKQILPVLGSNSILE